MEVEKRRGVRREKVSAIIMGDVGIWGADSRCGRAL